MQACRIKSFVNENIPIALVKTSFLSKLMTLNKLNKKPAHRHERE